MRAADRAPAVVADASGEPRASSQSTAASRDTRQVGSHGSPPAQPRLPRCVRASARELARWWSCRIPTRHLLASTVRARTDRGSLSPRWRRRQACRSAQDCDRTPSANWRELESAQADSSSGCVRYSARIRQFIITMNRSRFQPALRSCFWASPIHSHLFLPQQTPVGPSGAVVHCPEIGAATLGEIRTMRLTAAW